MGDWGLVESNSYALVFVLFGGAILKGLTASGPNFILVSEPVTNIK